MVTRPGTTDKKEEEKQGLSSKGMAKMDFSNRELKGFKLDYANVQHCNFQGSKLTDADLTCSVFVGVNMYQTDLQRARLCSSLWNDNCDLSYSNLSGCDLGGASFNSTNMMLADLRGANLRNCNLGSTKWFPAPEVMAVMGGPSVDMMLTDYEKLYVGDTNYEIIKSAIFASFHGTVTEIGKLKDLNRLAHDYVEIGQKHKLFHDPGMGGFFKATSCQNQLATLGKALDAANVKKPNI